MKNKTLILISIFAVLALGIWMYKELTKPLPGQLIKDLGREHVEDIAGIQYNSNPPTSGTHFPMWAKGGVYDRLISDGYLLHSLEHGYVIISYDCTKPLTTQIFISQVSAHDEPSKESSDSGELLKHMKLKVEGNMASFTPENQPEIEIELPEEFKNDMCKSLVEKLGEFPKKWDRVIVVPRVGMEKPLAVTAWTRIDYLDGFDKERIEKFISAYHNKGPEKTVEKFK